MDSSYKSDLPVFCWIVGCAIPINAASVCKYLFERKTNHLKPQLKASLINCQLYAAALSNLFHSEKSVWRSFKMIYEQLQHQTLDCLPDVKRLCGDLEKSTTSSEFCQATHVAFIECLMRLSITKLAPPTSLVWEIRRLVEEHPQLRNVVDLSKLQSNEPHSSGFVEQYSQLIHSWLRAVAWVVVPDVLRDNQAGVIDHSEFIHCLGIISLLSCAAYQYRLKVEKIVPSGTRAMLHKAPCLDAQLAAMSSGEAPMRKEACLKDDQSNASRLFAILGGILEEKKANGGKLDPPHISLIAAALCALPHFLGNDAALFSDLSALCSVAAIFHWFTGSKWPNLVAIQLAQCDFRHSPQTTPSSTETALRNSVVLQSLVRSSGDFAKKARPANPESIPAALVDLNTVEQLVSSTTSDIPEAEGSSGKLQQQEDGLLSELALTAALAVVDLPDNSSNANGVHKVKVVPKSLASSPLKRTNVSNENMNAYFLNKNSETLGVNPINRLSAIPAFKKDLPCKDLDQSSTLTVGDSHSVNPQEAIEQLVPMPSSQAVVLTTNLPALQASKQGRKTDWSERARLCEEKRSRSEATRNATITTATTRKALTKLGKGSGALRLSLDQQRRTIEANRQRALRQGDEATAQRNQAAFLALLQSSQKRRRQGAANESPSFAEEEEKVSCKFNDEFTVSQSDLPPEESAEEDPEEEYITMEKSDQKYSSSPVADVEATDMDDFSSSCVNGLADALSNPETQDLPTRCSSPPMENSKVEKLSTPRANRRSSPHSVSSLSSPGDDIDVGKPRLVSRPRQLHHDTSYEHSLPSTRSCRHYESRCSQCSHCNTQGYYDSIPRRRHGERVNADENDGDSERNVEYEEFYGTMPTRRVSKPSRGMRQSCRSVKSYQRSREFSPDEPDEDEDGFAGESASEIYWNTHVGRRRTLSRHHLRQRQLDALDSGDEFSYPAYSSALPPRARRLDLNHLGKSAGTGLDALVIAELARSVTTLRSDIERLTAQQLSLRSDLCDTDQARGAVVPVGSTHSSSRLNLTNAPSGSTRAMWNTRAPPRYPSQCDVQGNSGVLEETHSPCLLTDEYEPPRQASPLPKQIEQSEFTPSPNSKTMDGQSNATTKSPSSMPEAIKPPEKLIITFENPASERLQRARERLEARRAVDRSKMTESALCARMADQEAQFMAEVSEMVKTASVLPSDSVVSTDLESENSGFPVHTTNSNGTGSNGEGSSTTSGTPPKPTRPSSTRPRQPSTTSTNQRTSAISAVGSNRSGRASRSASLNRTNVRSSITSSNVTRPTTGARVSSTNERKSATSVVRQRSTSRRSTDQLSNGPSLSSLHRLENGDESIYSGPGLPIAGIQPQTRLYVKPKTKSNRQVIVNAISHYCLAGTVNESAKKLALKELAAVDGSHFAVLFRDSRCQYRALYAFDFDTEELRFICGNGPRKITHGMCEKFFKYNSGAKQFSEITSTKHLSAVVDAITIQNSWWTRAPPYHSNAARAAAIPAPSVSDETGS